METPGWTAFEQLEKRFIEFAIAHTEFLFEAAPMANLSECTFIVRRKKYNIPNPPPGHYTGPRLTQDEMYRSFIASLAPPAAPSVPALSSLENSLNVTFVPPLARSVES